jgi:nucleoside-diphosphate-sugar epimerase
MPADDRFLVTGALGCIGAWTVRELVREGTPVVAFDLAADARRLRLIMSPDELAAVTFATGDITDSAVVERLLDEHRITHIVHLAALQLPYCRADPALGARVNVVGTINVFEAARRRLDQVRGLVYTSSIAVFDAADADARTGAVSDETPGHPTTHYGVYKQANEGSARVYWRESGLASVGLRPMTVFGPGRDQGLTSAPTKAVVAAVVGRPFEIGFSGRTLFQYTSDLGGTLIIAARSGLDGARILNLGGTSAAIAEVVAAIEAVVPGAVDLIRISGDPLPFPDEIDPSGARVLGPLPITPLERAVAETAELFRRLQAEGRLDPVEHGLPAG